MKQCRRGGPEVVQRLWCRCKGRGRRAKVQRGRCRGAEEQWCRGAS